MVRLLSLLALLCLLANPTAAFELGIKAPDKPVTVHAAPAPDPDVLRQGGDTILDAVEIEPPLWNLQGTTTGYTDDYDEVCPFSQSTSPDVVYTWVASGDDLANIDMFGSFYDTKIYVYDENLELIACNDDYYPDYTSRIESMWVQYGMRYYLVIDGYGGDAGDYVLSIDFWDPPILDCPPNAQLEGEPELVDDYVDLHNGGCNTPSDPEYPRFQHVASQYFCGVSGWYLFDGANYRDTDWLTVTLPASGTLVVEADAEYESYLFELGPQDCSQVAVIQDVVFGPFWYQEMALSGEPGTDVWIWVGPTVFESPDGFPEYEYLLYLDNPVAVADRSWSSVKALFD